MHYLTINKCLLAKQCTLLFHSHYANILEKKTFINIAPPEKRICVLKSPTLFSKEKDDSKNITCPLTVYKYIQRPQYIENITLAECVAFHSSDPLNIKQREKPHIIWYVKYNSHIDPQNYYREKLILYVPFRDNEESLLFGHTTWIEAFHANRAQIEKKNWFNAQVDQIWGNIEKTAIEIDNDSCPTIKLDDDDVDKSENEIEKHDIINDLKQDKKTKSIQGNHSSLFSEIAHPFFLNQDFFWRRQLNYEQQSIVKVVVMKKKIEPRKPIYLFLTGGAGTRKIFTAKVLFQAMIQIYDKQLHSDPLKPKGIIVASTGKSTHNAGGVTAHSIFHLPCSSTKMLPLDSNTLDNLSKKLYQIQIFLIDEASLIGSRMLYNIDTRLHQIKHTPK